MVLLPASNWAETLECGCHRPRFSDLQGRERGNPAIQPTPVQKGKGGGDRLQREPGCEVRPMPHTGSLLPVVEMDISDGHG
jgi:hypothetical protein